MSTNCRSSSYRILWAIAILLIVSACTSPEERAAEYVESGNRLLASGDVTKASLEYRNALQINANLVDALYGLALIEERKHDWKSLFTILTRIRELDPRHSEARIKLAQLLLVSGRLDIALQDAQELLETFPDDAGTHALMAAVYYRLNNLDQAHNEIDKALEIDPRNKEANLVLARLRIGESDIQQAVTILDGMIAVDRFDQSPYLMKIQAYQQSGNNRGIAATLMDLIEIYPQKGQFKESLAQLYVAQGELQKAEQLYRNASESGSNSIADKLRLVSFLYRNISPEKGVSILEEYIRNEPQQYDLQFALAGILESEGEADAARVIYQGIVDVEGTASPGLRARTRMAAISLREGDHRLAEKHIAEVLSIDKFDGDALMIRAILAMQANDTRAAISDLRTVLRDRPDFVRALTLLGRAHESNGDNDLALSNYLKAFKLDPSSPATANSYARLLTRKNKTSIATEVLEESIARGNRTSETIKLLAQLKISQQDFESAETLAAELEKIHGEEANSYQLQGLIFEKKKQFEESVDAFKKAHELAPENARPIVALVKVYVLAGDFDRANSFLRSILKLDPENPLAYHLLVQVALAQNSLEEAEKAALTLIDIKPESEIAYRNLVLVRTRQKRYAEAESIARKGLERVGDSYALSVILASVLEEQQMFQEAISIYRSIHAKRPGAVIVRNNLASLLTDFGESEKSRNDALELSSDFKHSRIPHFRDTYAWASLNSDGDPGEAIAILEQVVDEVSTNPVFQYHLAVAYMKNGDTASAEKHLRRAIEYSGPDSNLKQKVEKMLSDMNA